MTSTDRLYPFPAVLGGDPDAPGGLDDMALALVLCVVHPGIGGVLVRGEKGTAKSTLVRALTQILPPIDVVGACVAVVSVSAASATSKLTKPELLTVPPPDLNDLGQDLSRLHHWIAELDDDEQQVAEGRPQDRGLVLSMIANLPGERMPGAR